jgi:hypothetical protein
MSGAVVHETKELDIEEPNSLVLDKETDTMESDVRSKDSCHYFLVWALLS